MKRNSSSPQTPPKPPQAQAIFTSERKRYAPMHRLVFYVSNTFSIRNLHAIYKIF